MEEKREVCMLNREEKEEHVGKCQTCLRLSDVGKKTEINGAFSG